MKESVPPPICSWPPNRVRSYLPTASSQGEGLGMVVIGVLMGSGSQRLVLGLRTETHLDTLTHSSSQ